VAQLDSGGPGTGAIIFHIEHDEFRRRQRMV